MKPKTKKLIMEWHNKGLSKFYIATKLKMSYWEVQKVIEREIKKDFESLF